MLLHCFPIIFGPVLRNFFNVISGEFTLVTKPFAIETLRRRQSFFQCYNFWVFCQIFKFWLWEDWNLVVGAKEAQVGNSQFM